MKLISVVGARPQFIKASVICHALGDLRRVRFEHRVVHTGQHYDSCMSAVFFQQLAIPAPDYSLGVGSGSHGEQTGEMMKRLEPVLRAERPDWILLYGDTNSTIAGALVGAKLRQRCAHIEAGLRCFNRGMPEEVNRIVTDHLSDLLFCPTSAAMQNLRREGLHDRAVLSGDVMCDAVLAFRARAEASAEGVADQWPARTFALATVHRAENTDNPERLIAILSALDSIASQICPVVFPVHPRTAKVISAAGWSPRFLRALPPVGYLSMLSLESRARLILTDSGGVQKEAYFMRVPCVTLRDETEWVETLENRCNILAGADEKRIWNAAVASASAGPWTSVYGDGAAGARILNVLAEHGSERHRPSIAETSEEISACSNRIG